MSSIVDMIQQHLGENGMAQVSQHLGVDHGTAQSAIAAAIPTILGAAHNAPGAAAMTDPQMAQPPSAGGFGGLSNLGGLGGLAGLAAGAGVLGNLFGGKHEEASREVSRKSGLDMHQAEKVLMMLAPIVIAQLAKQRHEAGPAASATPTQPHASETQTEERHGSGIGDMIQSAVGRILHKDG